MHPSEPITPGGDKLFPPGILFFSIFVLFWTFPVFTVIMNSYIAFWHKQKSEDSS